MGNSRGYVLAVPTESGLSARGPGRPTACSGRRRRPCVTAPAHGAGPPCPADTARHRALLPGVGRLRGCLPRLVGRAVHGTATAVGGRVPERPPALGGPGVRLRVAAYRRLPAFHAGRHPDFTG